MAQPPQGCPFTKVKDCPAVASKKGKIAAFEDGCMRILTVEHEHPHGKNAHLAIAKEIAADLLNIEDED